MESSGAARAFVGDLVYSRMHGFFADGFYEPWLANIARARRELSPETTFYPGHGEPGASRELLDWQEGYIRTFVGAVRSTAGQHTLTDQAVSEMVTATMKAYLPSEDLLFLMQLSIGPLRATFEKSRHGQLARRVHRLQVSQFVQDASVCPVQDGVVRRCRHP